MKFSFRWPRLLTALCLTFWLAAGVSAQEYDPVSWKFELDSAAAAPGGTAVARLKASIEPGWHLYSTTTQQGAPNALALYLPDDPSIASWEAFQPPPREEYDPNFEMESEWYVGEAEFLIRIDLSASAGEGELPIRMALRYGVCDDRMCLPPALKTVEATLLVDAQAGPQEFALPSDYAEAALVPIPARALERAGFEGAAGAEPREKSAAPPADGDGRDASQGLFQFAAVAFGFGLLAIFTPCVFPMIPITMSYFMSTQSGESKASVTQALTFCLGVIVLFTGIGAAVSAILGPFGMTQIGSSVWANMLIALVFFTFGFSLLGAFEITLPSGALTSLNRYASSGGTAGTLMMGLVFALASFACTGPFVGALLAGSVSGGGMAWPIFGMFMFSAGLALPFFFLALFPGYLKRMPKSGGWLSRTKITMGFVLFAVGFKYLSNVDQMYQWELLTRERFLAIWVVLFALAGLYLLGLLRLDGDDAPVGVGRLAAGALFLVFAVSLIPGMFGGRLGEIDAYVPSPGPSSVLAGAAAGGGRPEAGQWIKDDFEGALALARESGKPLFVNFTGYSCTNCKWMKANMFTRPEVARVLDGMILVELYTDGIDDASEANQRLQLERYRTVAIPYYAIVSGDGETLAEFPGRTRDTNEFLAFLETPYNRELAQRR